MLIGRSLRAKPFLQSIRWSRLIPRLFICALNRYRSTMPARRTRRCTCPNFFGQTFNTYTQSRFGGGKHSRHVFLVRNRSAKKKSMQLKIIFRLLIAEHTTLAQWLISYNPPIRDMLLSSQSVIATFDCQTPDTTLNPNPLLHLIHHLDQNVHRNLDNERPFAFGKRDFELAELDSVVDTGAAS